MQRIPENHQINGERKYVVGDDERYISFYHPVFSEK